MPSAAQPVEIRRLGADDLPAFKALRDEMLDAYPHAFTSDAAAERARDAGAYLHRLGLDRGDGGQFVLGAWAGERLVGAVGCERDLRVKVRHVAHVTGMMVTADAQRRGIGRALVDACIATARRAAGVEMLTLNVTAGNASAERLYERTGFVVYGCLPRAVRIGDAYLDKRQMVRML